MEMLSDQYIFGTCLKDRSENFVISTTGRGYLIGLRVKSRLCDCGIS